MESPTGKVGLGLGKEMGIYRVVRRNSKPVRQSGERVEH